MMKNFILNRLKENFGGDEEEEQEGFPDLNYMIGNSSAMDVGEVPTPLDERIGYASQIGGSVMELQITNPATFTLERDAMISTIDQLGIDVTLHSDMAAGYTTAYKAGGGYGYDTVEDYFTNYLQELAQFKYHVEQLGDGDEPLFHVGRINPHISTSPLPSLSERMAQDVAVDPFGFQVDEYDEESRQRREKKQQNIWVNEDFMRKLYHTFLKRTVDQRWQLFTGRQGLFTDYSDKFDRIYRDTMRQACDDFFDDIIDDAEDDIQAMISLVSTAARADVGVQSEWLNKIESDLDKTFENIEPVDEEGNRLTNLRDEPVEIDEISELGDLNDILPPNVRVTRVSGLAEAVYRIKNQDWKQGRGQKMYFDESEELKDTALSAIKTRLGELWEGKTENGEEDDRFLITVQGKLQALANNMDVEVDRIRNRALGKEGEDFENPSEDPWDIDEAAEEVMAGREEFFIDDEEEKRHQQFLRALLGNYGREMWKESNMFYRIIPAWMSEADKEGEKYPEQHPGWKAPKFIWEALIESQYEFDLKDPSAEGGYFEMLENDREFQMDVAAAAASSYVWGHFTQRKTRFDLKNRDFGLSEEEMREVTSEGWTWIDWMNRFGIGVNMETMAQQQNEIYKIWRPKHISVAAHAVNLTAMERIEEGKLGGLDHLNPEIDGRPAKFTIDMEHVATMGAPPLHEMELFIDQEHRLAEEYPMLDLDGEKPIAKIMRQIHLMDPGVEGQRGTHHGAIDRGNTQLYEWLYRFVEEGFARNEGESATVLFELAEHKGESSYVMRLMMNMIEAGIAPEDVTTDNIDLDRVEDNNYRDEKEALIARFFGLDSTNYSREWAKIEEHAFDPLDGMLEAEQFDHTYSGRAALENDNNPRDFAGEEYK